MSTSNSAPINPVPGVADTRARPPLAACRVAIADLHPTQMTIGFREVEAKRIRWREALAQGAHLAILARPTPVVRGPGDRLYAVDRHHWMRALADEGVTHVCVDVLADLSRHGLAEFWPALERRGWCRPFDGDGRRRRHQDIPSSIEQLTDDPFRSLVGALRRTGAVSKGEAPFAEFIGADMLRRHVSKGAAQRNFAAALKAAARLLAVKPLQRPSARPTVPCPIDVKG